MVVAFYTVEHSSISVEHDVSQSSEHLERTDTGPIRTGQDTLREGAVEDGNTHGGRTDTGLTQGTRMARHTHNAPRENARPDTPPGIP